MANHWKLVSDGTTMYRPHGKTWPQVALTGKEVSARDNNGKRPSETFTTDDLSVNGIKALLTKCISLPHPPDSMIEEFVNSVREKVS